MSNEVKAPTPFTIAGARAVADREDKGITVAIRDEQGDPMMTTDESGAIIPATAVLVGKLSTTYRKADLATADTMLRKRTTDLTSDLLEGNELAKIAACVKSWNLRDGTTPIPCDKFNVTTVLRAAPWIRRDFEAVMGDPSRFLA
jgi:hypothetical protein